MKVSPELRALLKVANKAHPELHAMLVDLQQYQPTLIVAEKPVAPPELAMESEIAEEANLDELRHDMETAEKALRRPVHLPPKACF